MPKLTKTQTQGIKDVMLAKEVSLKDLAQQVGTSVAALGNQIRGKDSVSDARLASIHNALGMGPETSPSNPKPVPKSAPETLERPVITLDDTRRPRLKGQSQFLQHLEGSRQFVNDQVDSFFKCLGVRLVLRPILGCEQLAHRFPKFLAPLAEPLLFGSNRLHFIESESPTDPDDDFEAAREFEDQAKRFARRCPHLFRAACSRVMAVASGW